MTLLAAGTWEKAYLEYTVVGHKLVYTTQLPQLLQQIRAVTNGLDFLIDRNICLLDLKAQNVLVRSDGTAVSVGKTSWCSVLAHLSLVSGDTTWRFSRLAASGAPLWKIAIRRRISF